MQPEDTKLNSNINKINLMISLFFNDKIELIKLIAFLISIINISLQLCKIANYLHFYYTPHTLRVYFFNPRHKGIILEYNNFFKLYIK